jgi:hypothetical protein
MPLLRFAYVLALALWLGSMIALGALVAPTLFTTLTALDPENGRALAGQAFGTILSRFHYAAYGAGLIMLLSLAAMALLGPRPRSLAIRLGIVVLMLCVTAYSGFIVLREVDGIQREIGAVAATDSSDHKSKVPPLPSSLPAADPRRLRFDALHVLSTRLMMFNIGAALVLLAWEAREPSR